MSKNADMTISYQDDIDNAPEIFDDPALRKVHGKLQELQQEKIKMQKKRELLPAEIEREMTARLAELEWQYQNAIEEEVKIAESVIEDERNRFNADMERNADKQLLRHRRLEAKYEGLRDDRLDDLAKKYELGEVDLSPDAITLLSRELRNRKSKRFDNFLSAIDTRNGLAPWMNEGRAQEADRRLRFYKKRKKGLLVPLDESWPDGKLSVRDVSFKELIV